jgi:hypothetical protein
LTVCSLESRAGFVSHRRRSWDSPFGGYSPGRFSRHFGRKEPTYRWPVSISWRRSASPVWRTSVSGFVPFGSALQSCGFLSRRLPAPPMGLAPLGRAAMTLAWISPSLLSPASRVRAITRRTRRRLRVSIGLRFASPDDVPKHTSAEATLMGFSHLPAPEHSSCPVPGLWSSPRVGPCIAASSPTLFGHR